jgi:rubrerythrin
MEPFDEDDAPPLKAVNFREGHWRIGGKRVSEEEGKAAAMAMLKRASLAEPHWVCPECGSTNWESNLHPENCDGCQAKRPAVSAAPAQPTEDTQ